MLSTETLSQTELAKVAQIPSTTTRVSEWLNGRLRGYVPALAGCVLAMALHGLAIFLFGTKSIGPLAFFLYLLVFLTGAWCGYGTRYPHHNSPHLWYAVRIQAGFFDPIDRRRGRDDLSNVVCDR